MMMKKKTHFILMWMPGLFWLYPGWMFRSDTSNEVDLCTIIHGLYTSLQLVAIIILFMEAIQ